MRDTCQDNQWPSDQFHFNVRIAARVVEGQLDPPPELNKIEEMVMREWLEFATEAGCG